MNDELQRQLAEFLKFLLAQAQDATTWAKTQIPPLIEDKIRFGRVWHSIVALVCLGLASQLWRFVRHAWRQIPDDDDWTLGLVAGAFGVAVAVGFALDALRDAVLAWTAPRLYVVEWLVALTKTKP
jgi:hypothetical protein